uniref:EF-hand domain-containing protein n=1 Tax=Schistocephalus solidus TaxID=70667 RepID=A0A0V0J1M3_SCHSO
MDSERQQFLRKFREMDIDKNGILSKEEVKSCLRASGFDKKFIKKFLATFDANGDGNITEEEYLRVVCTVPRKEKELAFWKSVFDDVDKDKSGKISCSELMSLLKDMNFDCKLSELQEWVNRHDQDLDGEMDFQEFMNMMIEGTL